MKTFSNENIWVIIPAYNEGAVIRQVVEEAAFFVKNIVVVNDCSKDDTSDKAVRAGAIVLNHIINLGQGAAIQTGTNYALQNGAEIIIHFDGDGQHVAGDMPTFISEIKSGFDVILGSRFLKNQNNIPFIKKITLKIGILFTWILSELHLTDTHNGFRALSRKAASLIIIRENRMTHASEILHEIKRLNLTFKEVPAKIKYSKYSQSKGQNNFNGFNIIARMIWKSLLLR